MSNQIINYEPPGPVSQAFMNDLAFVRGIRGPIGSGKSSCCVIEILRRSQLQLPGPLGKSCTRWAIIRNSYPELKTTTLKTWGDWCPTQFGRLTMDSPILHHVQTPTLNMEVYFLALDRPDDIRKLLSLELTGAWINEAREIPKAILDALTGRVGRYPAIRDGGATWSGIIMDTNSPDDQSWWYDLAENGSPMGYKFFSQPDGLSDAAENLRNLPNGRGYYERLIPGKEQDWVNVYVHNKYGYLVEGKPCFIMYRDATHCNNDIIDALPNIPLLIGVDFGLTPAAIFGQKLPDGRWHIIDEYIADNCGIQRFGESLMSYIAQNYSAHYEQFAMAKHNKDKAHNNALMPLDGFADPAGQNRGQNDERTSIEVIKEYTGLRWRAAPTNVISLRQEVVMSALNRMIDGKPGFLISPKCKVLRKGFVSGYHYKFLRTGDGTQVHETPAKNEYSHPHDALQYLLLGGGEHNIVMNKVARKKQVLSKVVKGAGDYKAFGY